MVGARLPTPIYFDWNSTTPPHPTVVARMAECATAVWGNPSSVHGIGRQAKEHVEQARVELAKYVHAHPRDVLFVSGGTEANNLALQDAPALVVSELEHPSITQLARELERQGRAVRWLRVLASGQIDLASLESCLCGLPKDTVVAVQAANHETGVVQPLADAAEIVHRAAAWLHVDAVQAVGKLAPAAFLAGDSYSVAAHKFRGPKGIGALVWRCGRPAPRPLFRGGSQQRGFRPGTLDTVAIVGFVEAFRLATTTIEERQRRLLPLRAALEVGLREFGESNCTEDARRLEHVASWYVPSWRGDELVAALDVEGLCVSSGSACSAGTAEPSPVICAMHDKDRAARTIRVSLGETSTMEEVERALEIVRDVIGRNATGAALR